MVRTRRSAPTCQRCRRGNDYHAARIGSVTDPVSTEPISCSHLRTRCLAADRSLATPATHIKVRVQSAERKSALTTRRPPRAASAHQSSCAEHPPRARLGLLGRRLLNVCVKFSEDEVESGVRSISADTLSDQPLSEWPAGREADRTLAQRTAAVGLTDRGSLVELALMADRLLRLADDDGFGPRRSEAKPHWCRSLPRARFPVPDPVVACASRPRRGRMSRPRPAGITVGGRARHGPPNVAPRESIPALRRAA